MPTPNLNIDVDMGALPEIRSYAAKSDGGNVFLTDSGSFYEKLPKGVSTISATAQGTGLTVHLTTNTGGAYRYLSRTADAGQTVVLSNVAVPKGETRYLNVQTKGTGDVGVTIITYPL